MKKEALGTFVEELNKTVYPSRCLAFVNSVVRKNLAAEILYTRWYPDRQHAVLSPMTFFSSFQRGNSALNFWRILLHTSTKSRLHPADMWHGPSYGTETRYKRVWWQPWQSAKQYTSSYRPPSLCSNCGVYDKNASDASPCPQQNGTLGTAFRPLWELMTRGF